MSLSVDDLVSSLSSSHIGQEAIELAALQEYLRQNGFGRPQPDFGGGPSSASSSHTRVPRRRTSFAQLCTTPTSQTPLTTPSGWVGYEPKPTATMEEEDEAMVEDLLMPPPSSPGQQSAFHHHPEYHTRSPSTASASRSHSHSHAYGRHQHPHQSPSDSHAVTSSSSSSIFTSSDPFYQHQQLQQQSRAHVVQPSSFYTQQHPHHQQGRLYQTHPHLSVDTQTQCMLVDT